MCLLSCEILNNVVPFDVNFSIFFTHRFSIELMESNQDRLKAAVILMEKLDYNEQMIYHLVLAATVSFYLCIFGFLFRCA